VFALTTVRVNTPTAEEASPEPADPDPSALDRLTAIHRRSTD